MVTPISVIGGINVYSETHILNTMRQDRDWTYDEETAYLLGWCNAADAYYYAVPGDCFSLDNAVASAKRRNKSSVVVNSLS